MIKSIARMSGILLLLAAAAAHAQKKLADEELDHATGTRVQVRSVFDPVPPSGYAPMRVVATNGTSRDGRWLFDFTSETGNYRQQNKHSSSFPLDVPGRSTQSALFLVPLAVEYGDKSYSSDNHSITVHISNTGFEEKRQYDNDGRIDNLPAIALSTALAELSIAGLNKEVEARLSKGGGYYGRRSSLFGSQFEPDDLPDSWLGFSGFDNVLLSSTDWQKLKPPVRRALLDWVRLGGRLDVFLSPGVTPAALNLGPEFTGSMRRSLGKIETVAWDGKRLDAADTVARYWGMEKRVADLIEGHTTPSHWTLHERLGERSFASWQVMAFLIVFGLLVGPVNLFVLAPAGKRHKLFVTTPLLSVGASVIMVGLILVQDGTGGVGRRFVAVNLEPGDAAAYVTQEQVSRTGVLLSTGFTLKQPVLIEPVAMPPSPWAKLSNNHTSHAVELTQQGRDRRGNFFQSRAEQGQVLRAVVPTRARVELKTGTAPGDAPVLVSALGFTVDELCYADAAGAIWTLTEPLATGQSATLVKADFEEKNLRNAALLTPAEESLREQLEIAVAGGRQFFAARANSAPDLTIETLPSIRWQKDQIFVFGPVAQP